MDLHQRTTNRSAAERIAQHESESNIIGLTPFATPKHLFGHHAHDTTSASTSSSLHTGLTAREWRRRLWHMFPGLLPVLSWAIPHEDPMTVIYMAIVTTIILGLAIAILLKYHTIAREHEHNAMAGIVGYSCTVAAMFWLFPAHEELALTVVMILAFGDGAATFSGLAFQGRRLPWNSHKTWAGTLGFILIATPLASLVYWAKAAPTVSVVTALLCAGTATLIAAIVESLPVQVNDNLRVGLTSAITVVAAHSYFVGLA